MSKSTKTKAQPKEPAIKDEPKEVVMPKMVVNENGKVKIKTTSKAPHHEADKEIEILEFLAVKMVTNGWAELIK